MSIILISVCVFSSPVVLGVLSIFIEDWWGSNFLGTDWETAPQHKCNKCNKCANHEDKIFYSLGQNK